MLFITATLTANLGATTVAVASLRRQQPDAEVAVLLVDQYATPVPDRISDISLYGLEQLGIDKGHFHRLVSMYAPNDLINGLTPLFIEHLAVSLEQSDFIYFSPENYFLSFPEELSQGLKTADIVFCNQYPDRIPKDDGFFPDEQQFVGIGEISTFLFALRYNEFTAGVLKEWAENYSKGQAKDSDLGDNPLSIWFRDLTSRYEEKTKVIRQQNYCLGYWNLFERSLEKEGDTYLVDRLPLRNTVFYAFDQSQKKPQLSHIQDRIVEQDQPALLSLIKQYKDELYACGSVALRSPSLRYEMLPDTQIISKHLRIVYRQGLAAGEPVGDMATEAGFKRFFDWLAEPVDIAEGAQIGRFLAYVYYTVDGLKEAYSDLNDPETLKGYMDWVYVHGADSFPVPKQLVPSPSSGIDKVALRAFNPPRPLVEGVNIAGFFSSELGLGEAARLLVSGIEAAGIPNLPIHGVNKPGVREGVDYQFLKPRDAIYPVNIICINGDGIPGFAMEAGPEFFKDRYTIGMWWWEVQEVIPPAWYEAFEYLDEIWVGTDFVYDAVKRHSPIPVTKVVLPLTAPQPKTKPSKELLSLPDGFNFLYMYDYFSCSARKNPEGLVQAYKKAFPKPVDGINLVLKCLNSRHMSAQHARVLWEIGGREDIKIIDHYLDADLKDALIDACDCYISLHRSEGLGLGLAEAVYLNKPLISTGYGGVLDFITAEDGYLVDYTLKEIGYEGYPYYPAGGYWAEPDLDQGAVYIRDVYENYELAQQKADRAAVRIRETNSHEASASSISRRLEEIVLAMPEANRRMRACVSDELKSDFMPLLSQIELSQNPLKRKFQQLIFRLMRPYTHANAQAYQQLNRETQNQFKLDVVERNGRALENSRRVNEKFQNNALKLRELERKIELLEAELERKNRT